MTPPVGVVENAVESLANLVYLMQRDTDAERLREYISMADSAVQVLVQALSSARSGERDPGPPRGSI